MKKLKYGWSLFIAEDDKLLKKCRAIKNLLENKSQGLFFESVKVPAILENVLSLNKVLGDFYYSVNCWEYAKYESYHQFYFIAFDCEYERPQITFEGIDGIAEIFVNGKKIGFTENAFLPYSYELSGVKRKNNELIVHLLPAVPEGKKYPAVPMKLRYTQESMNIRKSACSYGWDIFPRTPLGGIWKDVFIEEKRNKIEDVQIVSFITGNVADLKFVVETEENTENGKITVNGVCKDSEFDYTASFCGKKAVFNIKAENFYPWNVRGYGEQNLYSVKIAIEYDETRIEKTLKYGIRKTELIASDTVCDGGKFEFHINGNKVFVTGTNWVPVEAIFHCDAERMKKALQMAVDLNCNAVRVWGGGVYESDEFYDLCDEYGLLVWQDFMMACATYPQTDEFCEKIRKEAEYQIKRLRNHPCVCLFCGDNECDGVWYDWGKVYLDPNENVLTRRVLAEAVKKYADYIPYLPSSPYISEKFVEAEKTEGRQYLPEDHLWGARDYFKSEYYAGAKAYFASETGYHGCPAPESLRKFIKNVYPLFDGEGRPTKEYLCHATSVKDEYDSPHAYRIKLMSDQVKILFGETFDNISDFALASQISQAEALKFFIESFRADRNFKGGIIWWNVLDGWPQISDAVVDYYFTKKLAYGYIKRSQQSVALVMKEEGDKAVLVGINDTAVEERISYTVTDLYTGKRVLSGYETLSPRFAKEIAALDDPKTDKTFYLMEWSDGKEKSSNHFHTHIKNVDYRKYVSAMRKAGYDEREGF